MCISRWFVTSPVSNDAHQITERNLYGMLYKKLGRNLTDVGERKEKQNAMTEKHEAFALSPGSSSGSSSFAFIPLFLCLSDPSAGLEQARRTL